MKISQNVSERHSREHKLLGIRKGLGSAFLQWVVIGKVKKQHREGMQLHPSHRGLA